MVKWYDRIGNPIEMRVGKGWIKGTVIDGERTGDGIINMETEDGKKYWCGVSTEGVWYRKCDDSLGDLITQADKIRSMSDEELAKFMHNFYDCGHCYVEICNEDTCAIECEAGLLGWLKSEAKE